MIMLVRKLTKVAIFAITVLSATLLYEYILTQIPNFKDPKHPYQATAMGMLVVVIVFYPAFTLLENVFKKYNKEKSKSKIEISIEVVKQPCF